MRSFLKVLLISFVLFALTRAFAQAPNQFSQSDVEQAMGRLNSMNPAEYVVPGINNYQIILVGGFLGELSHEYLEANENAIRFMGAEHVLRIQPNSRNSVETNIEFLKSRILAENEIHKKPIILWGHSKGGVESLGLILKYPELVRNGVIKLVIPMQSPIGGCVGGSCASFAMMWTRSLKFFDGMHSLSSEAIHRLITQRLAGLDTETREMLSNATAYVVSNQDPRLVDTVLQASAFGMTMLGQKNDALVAEQAMSIKNFGRIFGRVVADHMQMVMVATKGIAKKLLTTGTLEQVYGLTFMLMNSSVSHLNHLENQAQIGRSVQASPNKCITLFK